MTDAIDRQAAIDVLDVLCQEHRYKIPGKRETYSQYNEAWQDALDRAEGAIFNLPSAQPEAMYYPQVDGVTPSVIAEPERKKGKWTEKHHAYSDEESVIEEWQSCRCSECGRYDTRPYMYYFSEPNYCSYCGADMRSQDA